MIRKFIKHSITAAFCLGVSGSVWAQKDKPEYGIVHIPENLLKNSHSVVREDRTELTIYNTTSSKLSGKMACTILNKKGDDNTELTLFYDKSNIVKSISGTLYDKNGKLIRKLKNSEINDYSAVSTYSIMEDSRVKYAQLLYPEYPFTVEFEYEYDIKESYHLPSWYGVSSHSESVMHSSLLVKTTPNYELRFEAVNYDAEMTPTSKEGFLEYYWEIKNYPAIVPESYMVHYAEVVPRVVLGPSEFSVGGYSGNAASWKSFGEFFWKLNAGRDQLPETVATEIKALTADAKTDREKIKRVYQYLQKTTRYVSIQLGIGGLQPFEAEYVKKHGYGDCKALSNYMYAMLKSLGINSIYTLVKAGNNTPDIQYDFPAFQFNHAILCVPNEGDTLWLECTSQTAPFGYLGRFTMDRHVLLITEQGGVIAKTPAYEPEQNLQLRKAIVTISENGSAVSEVSTQYTGYQYENVDGALDIGEEDQKKFLYENISIPSFEINGFSYVHEKEAMPVALEKLQLQMRRYATVSGKRIFFQPNLMNQGNKLDKPQTERKFEMEIGFPYTDIDTVIYYIPEGYHLEFLPDRIEYQSDFGSYFSRIEQREGQIIYTRKRVAYKGRYPSSKYLEFVEYANKIADADRQKIVLVKST